MEIDGKYFSSSFTTNEIVGHLQEVINNKLDEINNKMTKLEFLESLVKEFPSDIGQHGYLEPLSRHLPDTCRSMLEIGIAEGNSALIWSSFYGNDTLDLFYIDLFINPAFVSPRWCRNRGIVPIIGSQSDLRVLASIKEQFSCCLDDGSHNAYDMAVSFKHLFLNNLLSGGIYFITDTHCNKDSFYWGQGVEVFEDTPLWVFKNYIETGKIQSKFFNEGESEVFESLIESVHIEANEKMIVIKRK